METHTDLSRLGDDALALLGRGTVDRRSALRWFVLATTGIDGLPKARTVVLRKVDRAHRTITVFTDARAAKVAEVEQQPGVACHFFDPKPMIQMRFEGHADILRQGPVWQSFWDTLSERGKQDYASATAPGEPGSGHYDTALAQQYFTVLQIRLIALDWLNLSRDGHSRAQIDWRSDPPNAAWVTP